MLGVWRGIGPKQLSKAMTFVNFRTEAVVKTDDSCQLRHDPIQSIEARPTLAFVVITSVSSMSCMVVSMEKIRSEVGKA